MAPKYSEFFIVFPFKMGMFHRYVNVYQRVDWDQHSTCRFFSGRWPVDLEHPPEGAGGSHCFVQLRKMMERLTSLASSAKDMMDCWFGSSEIIPSYTEVAGSYTLYYMIQFSCAYEIPQETLVYVFLKRDWNWNPCIWFQLLLKKKTRGSSGVPIVPICSNQPIIRWT